MKALGYHLLLEFKGCPEEILTDQDFIERTLLEASRRAKTHVISKHFHTFSPHGVSGAIVIAESHISIHTWPEFGYAALDIFTCGDNALPHLGTSYLIDAFRPQFTKVVQVERGLFGAAGRLMTPRTHNLDRDEVAHGKIQEASNAVA